jgi:fused signal recognition particle receptor
MIDTILTFINSLPPASLWAIAVLVFLLVALAVYRMIRRRSTEIVPSPDSAPQHPLEKFEPEAEPLPEETPPPTESTTGGVFQRLKSGLTKTRQTFIRDMEALFTKGRGMDADLMDQLEELLITSDMGVQTTSDLIETLSRNSTRLSTAEELKDSLRKMILEKLEARKAPPISMTSKPHVIMVVGVNGVGKTTTIGKLAARYTAQNQKVLIAAADTFRAAAVEQLAVWADRAGTMLIKHREGADPAAVAFDGVEAGISRGADVVMIDTAGRLHTKVNLMEELKKVKRTIQKRMPDAPHEVLLVVDATTGQNALSQARQFHEAIGLTDIALTKLDGTAKGGIVIGICDSMNVPLRYIGVGEQIEDLQDFDPEAFVDALFS